ncbi:MAG: IS66 family insertion sequence element accessory protein TnpB, partial [Pseudomonadota bacterium]
MSKHRSIEARRSLVEGFGGSGLSVEAYCARESIKVSSFRRWRRQLVAAPDVPCKALPAVSERDATPTFVDLGTLSDGGSRFDLRLDLGRGVVLHLTC